MPLGLSAADITAIVVAVAGLISAVTALVHELRRGGEDVKP